MVYFTRKAAYKITVLISTKLLTIAYIVKPAGE